MKAKYYIGILTVLLLLKEEVLHQGPNQSLHHRILLLQKENQQGVKKGTSD